MHLENLEWSKSIRAKARREEARPKKQKFVDDYNWASLLEQGKLGTLTVSELDKYIKHHSLPNNGKKPDKIRCIALHLSAGNAYTGPQDGESELTDITMPSTASSTRSGRRVRPRAQEEYFFTKSIYVSSKTLHC